MLIFPKTTLKKEVFAVKFEGINIDEVKAGTVALSDKEGNPVEGGFFVSLYRDGKEVGCLHGIMIPYEENQKIPPFRVDFSILDK